jgi:hypothetical protein
MKAPIQAASRCVGQSVATPASQCALWQVPAVVGLQLPAVGALALRR